MMTNIEIATVRDWHQALNAGNVNGLIALSSEDVEVGDPRGSGRGAQLLRDWFSRAGLRLKPRQMFHRGATVVLLDDHGGSTVVVEQDAVWRAPDTGEVTGRQVLASVFVVHDERVTSVIRYPDLASA